MFKTEQFICNYFLDTYNAYVMFGVQNQVDKLKRTNNIINLGMAKEASGRDIRCATVDCEIFTSHGQPPTGSVGKMLVF